MEDIKRKEIRLTAVIDINYLHKGYQMTGRVEDLSSGGFFIDTIHPLSEHSAITFEFILPGDKSETPISGEGEVAWTLKMQGMGIRITKMSDDDRKRLEDFVTRF
jgi:uncharacterized protein (TIGR02266 family)